MDEGAGDDLAKAVAKFNKLELERKEKEKKKKIYSKDSREKIKQPPPLIDVGGLGERNYEKNRRNNDGNTDLFIAGLQQLPDVADKIKDKLIEAGTPESEAESLRDRSYRQGVEQSKGPTIRRHLPLSLIHI